MRTRARLRSPTKMARATCNRRSAACRSCNGRSIGRCAGSRSGSITRRSVEHTSVLQSLMLFSYSVFFFTSIFFFLLFFSFFFFFFFFFFFLFFLFFFFFFFFFFF